MHTAKSSALAVNSYDIEPVIYEEIPVESCHIESLTREREEGYTTTITPADKQIRLPNKKIVDNMVGVRLDSKVEVAIANYYSRNSKKKHTL